MKKYRYLLCVLFGLFGGCSEGDKNSSEKTEQTRIFTEQSQALEQARQVEQLIQNKDVERRSAIEQQRQ